MKTHKYVGMDVHKDTIEVAVADDRRDGEIRAYGSIAASMHAVERMLAKVGGEGITLHLVYEAGPTGFVLYRHLTRMGYDCQVVAPVKMNQGKKTDRRDAASLAKNHRSGELTAVYVPDAADEAVRDLTRARASAAHEVTRAKNQLKSLLLRHGYTYKGKANWSEAHMRYLRGLLLSIPALQALLEEHLQQVDQALARVSRMDKMLEEHVPKWRHYPAVQAVMCLRGFQLTGAATIVSEVGDIHRFTHPRQLMAYLGLIPSEETSGTRRRLGSITKAGNVHARWILVESVQHAFLPPRVSPQLSARQEDQPDAYKKHSWKVQSRLYHRGRALLLRNKMRGKITVALAREMAGHVWALLKMVPPNPA